MKYLDINIQIKYPNKLINADTSFEGKRFIDILRKSENNLHETTLRNLAN